MKHHFKIQKPHDNMQPSVILPYLAGATTPVSTALERSPVEKEENRLPMVKLVGKLSSSSNSSKSVLKTISDPQIWHHFCILSSLYIMVLSKGGIQLIEWPGWSDGLKQKKSARRKLPWPQLRGMGLAKRICRSVA